MDLNVLDQTSKMTPLLVKLYDSQTLHGLAKDEKPLARAELTSAITELLQMELSPRENELVADVLISLMRQAERDLRQALSERLSVMENVPLRLILQMANDDIDVAGTVLTKSTVLSDLDLIYIVKSKGAEHWQAIAKRKTMSDQMINVLVDTGESKTVKSLVENNKITLTEYSIDVIADMACDDEMLAKPLLQREEVCTDIAKRLYQHVGKALKDYIVDAYELEMGSSIADLVDDVMIEFVEAAEENESLEPTQSMVNAAQRYKEKGLLTVQMMMRSLRRGQLNAFVAQFSQFTGMKTETVASILAQRNGQGLAVASRACDITKADFMSIFLLTNRIRSKGKMVDLGDMTKAMNYYTRIDAKVAKDIIQHSMDEALKD
ncbi:MAG: DUF2336 domain-containing protein [Bdellovibrionales bacterium]